MEGEEMEKTHKIEEAKKWGSSQNMSKSRGDVCVCRMAGSFGGAVEAPLKVCWHM